MGILKSFFRNGLAVPAMPTQPDFFGKLDAGKKNVLHVGCGAADPLKLPMSVFPAEDWHEVRLDIDADVAPDIVASITDLTSIPGESFDAVFSSHNLEHLYAHEVPLALFEFLRVLKPGGFAMVLLPDLQTAAELVAQNRLEEVAYVSPAGPITPLDMIFGFRPALAAGNHFMAHRCGFTADALARQMQQCGFSAVEVSRLPHIFSLQAIGFRAKLTDDY